MSESLTWNSLECKFHAGLSALTQMFVSKEVKQSAESCRCPSAVASLSSPADHVCTIASLSPPAQYGRLLMAHEVTTQVPAQSVPPPPCTHTPGVRLKLPTEKLLRSACVCVCQTVLRHFGFFFLSHTEFADESRKRKCPSLACF